MQQRVTDMDKRSTSRARISAVDRLEYFLRSRASKVVVLALVANTMVAQLLYNSAGQLVIGNQVLLGYLIVSAICSTVAFALFEVSTIFQLHDLMALDVSIKAEIGAEKLIKRGYFVLAVSSLINFLSVLYFLALAWHTGSGVGTKFPLDDLPQPWNWLYYGVHASVYTAVLFLAGIFGERPKSGKEVILATQRALEQQALERWKLQKEAQIEQMMRDGVPLDAVAAARLNVRRAGHDLALLDGLDVLDGLGRQRAQPRELPPHGESQDGEEVAALASPLSRLSPLPMAQAATNGRSSRS